MNTTHIIAGVGYALSLWLSITIAFNAGVKRERKSWQEFARIFRRMVER